VPSIILVEVFKHLCIAGRKEYATSCIRSFELKVHPLLIQLTSDLIIEAGLLKCQFRNTLSYTDSIAIAIALKEKAPFHTTEKNLPQIHNLQVISYEF
jgi:PIN domain nuclease of toxin-antitoxin system